MSPWRRRLGQLRVLFAELWALSLLLARGLLPILLLVLVLLILWALFARQPWPYAIDAQTEHVSLSLAADLDTNWRIDGAQLCVRATGDPLDLPPLEADSLCAGARWRDHDLSRWPELTLRLPAAASVDAPTSVRLDVETDGALLLQVTASANPLLLVPGRPAPVPLTRRLILRFPSPAAGESPGRVLLPFSGSGSIGRDVSWSEPRLLRAGEVFLYTRSDQAAGGRALVANVKLLPGDRVDVGKGSSPLGVVPKGFVHFDLKPEHDEPPVMRVVAFGEAENIRILRFGEPGYGISPSLLARISHHPAVETWMLSIVSLLGLLGALLAVHQGFAALGQGRTPALWPLLGAYWRRLRRHR